MEQDMISLTPTELAYILNILSRYYIIDRDIRKVMRILTNLSPIKKEIRYVQHASIRNVLIFSQKCHVNVLFVTGKKRRREGRDGKSPASHKNNFTT